MENKEQIEEIQSQEEGIALEEKRVQENIEQQSVKTEKQENPVVVKKTKISHTRQIVIFSILLALVIVFQIFGSYIKIGTTSFNFVLVPIVLGGAILGVWAGTALGFASAIIIIIMGLTGLDGFTNMLFTQSTAWAVVGTVLTILIKGVVSALVSAIAYKLLAKKNKTLAIFVAAALTPILNTGIFIIGMLCMSGVISDLFVQDGQSVIYFLFIVCAGINFLVEFAINIILAPAVKTVERVVGKNIRK